MDWNDVSVDRFLELNELQQDDFNSLDEFILARVSIILDKPIEELEEMDIDDYAQLLQGLGFIVTEPNKHPKPSITTPAGPLYLIPDFKAITIGEFIDLENLFTQGYLKNFKTILSICYRQKDIKKSLLYLDEFEPYGNWIFHRSSLFNDLSINDVYGVVHKYLDFRTAFFETYEGLFEDTSTGDDVEEDLSKLTHAERNEIRKAEAKERSLAKWNWDLYLYKLAKSDPTKIEEASKMPLLLGMNLLSMKKELQLPE